MRALAALVASLWLPAGGTFSSVRPAGGVFADGRCAVIDAACSEVVGSRPP